MSEKPGCGGCRQKNFAGISLPSFGAESYSYGTRGTSNYSTPAPAPAPQSSHHAHHHQQTPQYQQAAAPTTAYKIIDPSKYTINVTKLSDITGSHGARANYYYK